MSGTARVISIIVADDQPLIRGGIKMLLSVHADLHVVGEAATGEEAVVCARRLRPGLVIMDLSMPGMGGIEATRVIAEEFTDVPTRVLALTTFNDDASVYGALRAGASGYLVKDAAPVDLVDAARAIADGQSWIDPSVAGQVLKGLRESPDLGDDLGVLATLTAREREVLVLMTKGLSNLEISAQLVLSEATTRTHVSRILMKTGSRDRTQAVVLAFEAGLVRPGIRP